jgi:3-phenylpropionate/trans-cinnamate dioxygenase ferredoxin reductase subunit
MSNIVIIGAGHCGGQLAARLRSEGFDGRVQLVGAESIVPYQRPPLSKQYLAGEVGLERVYLRPEDSYAASDIELLLDTQADAIDRSQRSVRLSDGRSLDYDKLVLATGSRVRKLELPGADAAKPVYLRTIADADLIRSKLNGGGVRVAVVGGGYIGLEVASVAATLGAQVTVLEMAGRLMSRVVATEVSDFYHRLHTDKGVDVRTDVMVEGFEPLGAATRVLCDDGSAVEADLIIVGVGIIPNTELADRAGLDVDDGVRVDEYGCTSDPAIYAAGDCTNHPNALYGERVRLESVHNAMSQARVVAANLCGKQTAYAELPWFWSDQYDVKLQIAGLSSGFDQTLVRGSTDDGTFSVFYLKEGVLIAADTVNGMHDHLALRTLITKQARLSAEQLTDSSVSLKDLSKS